MSDVLIEISNVSLDYFEPPPRKNMLWALKSFAAGGSFMQRVPALQDVSFTLRSGDRVGLIGNNGAGKSSLLRVMAGILEPRQGKVISTCQCLPVLDASAGLLAQLSVEENIVLLLRLYSSDRLRPPIEDILKGARLESKRHTLLRSLSTGQKQRLFLTTVLFLKPQVILFDETLANVDREFKQFFGDRFQDFPSLGITYLLASHDEESLRSLCTTGVLLHNGKIEQVGGVDAVLQSYHENRS